jgi:hypothetical protein
MYKKFTPGVQFSILVFQQNFNRHTFLTEMTIKWQNWYNFEGQPYTVKIFVEVADLLKCNPPAPEFYLINTIGYKNEETRNFNLWEQGRGWVDSMLASGSKGLWFKSQHLFKKVSVKFGLWAR